MLIVKILGIIWVAILSASYLSNSLWQWLIIATVALLLGVLRASFRRNLRLTLGLGAIVGILIVTANVLSINYDHTAKVIAFYTNRLGLGIVILTIIIGPIVVS